MLLFHIHFQDNWFPGRVYITEKIWNAVSTQKLTAEFLLEFIWNARSEILASDLKLTNVKTVYKTPHENPLACQI